MGDGWFPYLFSVRRIKASNDTVRRFAAEAGRDLTGFHWGLAQPIAISSDASEALALAVVNVGERYVTPERSAESIAQSLCIAGTPEQCIRAVQDRIDAGVEHINLRFMASEPDHLFHQMKMFAASVMPQFQS